MKFISAVMASLLFAGLLLLTHWAHMRWLEVDVVFYAALGDVALACVLAGACLVGLPAFGRLKGFEKGQLMLIWLLTGYALAISVPTVIDRSLSFYILEKLQQRGGGIRADRFEQVFTQEYLKEHRLVDVRLTEQLQSGSIRIDHGCVTLTEKGRDLASFSRFYRQNLLPRRRLLMGQYTDELTDPFRHSGAPLDYLCR